MVAHPAHATLEKALRDAAGQQLRLTGLEPAGGGCSHDAFVLHAGGGRYFAKLDHASRLPVFQAEADGLAAIAQAGCFRTPAVLACGDDGRHAYLLLEFLDLQPLRSAEDGARFAAALAAQHAHTSDWFGWARDNYLGASPQCNGQTDNWARFFADCRLRPQLAQARSNGFGGDLQKHGERLCERLPALFLDYRPRPALLHGDLWHGNAAVLADGTPVVFDPAIHHGDRESDLAMSELFGGFPAAFYAAYRRLAPLNEGYEQRKLLYSLYHILNHLNLFGRGYLGEAMRLLNRLNAHLSMRRD